MHHVVWWSVTNISEDPKDEGSTVLQNFGIQPPYYAVQQPGKPKIQSQMGSLPPG